MRDTTINTPPVQSLEELNGTQDHHPASPNEPKDRVIHLTFNFDINQATLEEARRLAADLENAGEKIKLAWIRGELPIGCEVFGLYPDSCEVFIKNA